MDFWKAYAKWATIVVLAVVATVTFIYSQTSEPIPNPAQPQETQADTPSDNTPSQPASQSHGATFY